MNGHSDNAKIVSYGINASIELPRNYQRLDAASKRAALDYHVPRTDGRSADVLGCTQKYNIVFGAMSANSVH